MLCYMLQIQIQIQYKYYLIVRLIQDLDMYVLKFSDFGQKFIKQQKISPDVFIQLALQLTYFKLHRRVVSTYESCSLRQFRHGRVDNIRSATKESLAWARCMCGESDDIPETVFANNQQHLP